MKPARADGFTSSAGAEDSSPFPAEVVDDSQTRARAILGTLEDAVLLVRRMTRRHAIGHHSSLVAAELARVLMRGQVELGPEPGPQRLAPAQSVAPQPSVDTGRGAVTLFVRVV
ncbi:MAG TPA: hypothetical protein VIV60_24155 [Polyangiaceae bacterium]